MIFAFFKTMPASYPISYSAKKSKQKEASFTKYVPFAFMCLPPILRTYFYSMNVKRFDDIFPELINRLICNFLAHDMPHYPIRSRTTIVRRSLRNRK